MSLSLPKGPKRIVCLTEEPTEILYALGEGERVVGISAYTVRPPEAPRDKPVVSAFIGGSIEKICALKPDLIIGFSDIQAELAKDLVAAHQTVLIFNQRSVQEILEVVLNIGRLVGAGDCAAKLCDSYVQRLDALAAAAAKRSVRPKVYFEEWDEPMITAIEWVSELIEIAGGDNIFADRATGRGAKERFVRSDEVIARDPDLIFASWCGKPVSVEAIVGRSGWSDIGAVIQERIVEVAPEIILQPGPASLTDGVDLLARVIGAIGDDA